MFASLFITFVPIFHDPVARWLSSAPSSTIYPAKAFYFLATGRASDRPRSAVDDAGHPELPMPVDRLRRRGILLIWTT